MARRGASEIRRRVDQKLSSKGVGLLLGDQRRQIASSRVATDRYTRTVPPLLSAVLDDPGRHRRAVDHRGRRRMLGSESVVDRHHHTTHCGGEVPRDRGRLLGRAEHPAAAVEPDDDRMRASTNRSDHDTGHPGDPTMIH